METTGAYDQYQRTQILTAPPGKLVLMLYDGVLRFCREGRAAIEADDKEGANRSLVRAQDIIAELQASLNFEAGEIARNLYSLYEFVYRRLVEANVRKDASPIDDAEKIIAGLRETWEQVLELAADGDEEEADKNQDVVA